VIKEMRLRGIETIEEGNQFLKEYLPVYNRRFSVCPREKEDLHRPPQGDRSWCDLVYKDRANLEK
jgi:hypothetical protein